MHVNLVKKDEEFQVCWGKLASEGLEWNRIFFIVVEAVTTRFHAESHMAHLSFSERCIRLHMQAPPEPKYVAFQGTGRTLGSSVQQVDEDPAPPAATPVSREFSNQILQGLVVDDTKPATSIQLRLQDGTRLVARFNHSHTVADIRGFIDAARPGHSGPYSLQSMGFPPKQLSDPTQTVEQAGLINAVVIQK